MLFIKNVVFNSAFDKENEWSNLYGIKRHRNNIVISVTCESHLLSNYCTAQCGTHCTSFSSWFSVWPYTKPNKSNLAFLKAFGLLKFDYTAR